VRIGFVERRGSPQVTGFQRAQGPLAAGGLFIKSVGFYSLRSSTTQAALPSVARPWALDEPGVREGCGGGWCLSRAGGIPEGGCVLGGYRRVYEIRRIS